MDEKVSSVNRPRNITVVSLFYWFNAIALGAIGVVITLSLIVPYFDGTLPRSQASEELSSVLLFGVLVLGSIALAIFIAVIGTGLWRFKSWARRAAIVISSLIIVANFVLFVNGIIKGQPVIPYGIVFHGLALMVLTSMSVKKDFEPKGIEPDTSISETGLEKEQGVNLKNGMTCSHCGNVVLPKDRFCRKCGRALQ